MRLLPIAATFLLMTATVYAQGCWFCVLNETKQLWSPVELTATEAGARIRLQSHQEPYEVADLYYDRATGRWRHLLRADQAAAKATMNDRLEARSRRCGYIPYKPPSAAIATALRPHLRVGHTASEGVGACVERNDLTWFGLTFYEGEGADGVGGIGAFSQSSGAVEVRRPEWIRDKSIDHLVHDGRTLWFSAAQHYEHNGPSYGLVRYDWRTRKLEPLRGANAPCGWSVTGLELIENELWVTTTIALSRLNLAHNRWQHYAIAADGSRLLPRSCESIYRRLLDAAAKLMDPKLGCQPVCDDLQPPEVVAEFHPEFARRYLMQQQIVRPLTWTELMALARVARNFAEVERALTRPAQDGDYRMKMTLEAYANRKDRDLRFRDVAIAAAKNSGDWHLLRYFRGDPHVSAALFAAIEKKTDLLNSAIETTPWVMGKMAIVPLLRLLDQYDPDTTEGSYALSEVIQALERAAHIRIATDGSRLNLAENSDRPEYADEEFGAFRPRGDAATLRTLIAHWKKHVASSGR